jgi:hypothetical protein
MRMIVMRMKILLLLIISIGVSAREPAAIWSVKFSPEKNVANLQTIINGELGPKATCTFKDNGLKKDGKEIAEENIDKKLLNVLQQSDFSKEFTDIGIKKASVLSLLGDGGPDAKGIFSDCCKEKEGAKPEYDIDVFFQDNSRFSIFSTKYSLDREYLRELLGDLRLCEKSYRCRIADAKPELDFTDYTPELASFRAFMDRERKLQGIKKEYARIIDIEDEMTEPSDGLLTRIKLCLALKYIEYRLWKTDRDFAKKKKEELRASMPKGRAPVMVFNPTPTLCLKKIVDIFSKIKRKFI